MNTKTVVTIALVVAGGVKVVGKVPSIDKVKDMLA